MASLVAFLAMLCFGGLNAFAAGGISVDASVNAGSSGSFAISTSQPNELILVAANGWPCAGGQAATVDGSPATLIAAIGGFCDSANSGGASVFQFVAPSAGSHSVAITSEGGYCCGYFNNFAVSLLNASDVGLTSTSTWGPTTPSITTSVANQYVFATSTINTGTSSGSMAWNGSPVTPTLLEAYGLCCGIDSSIAGFAAPSAGSYSANLTSTTGPYSPDAQVTILVAVQQGGDSDAPIAAPTQSPAANGAGWNDSDVTVDWNWADEAGGSGIDAGNCTTSSVSSGEGTITLSATCADVAGNIGSATYDVQVDKTDPVVAFSGNAGTYTVDQTVSIGCSATDALSGIATSTCPTVSASAVSLGLGSHSLTATATDNAGNTKTVTTSYTVVLNDTGLCALVHQLSSSEDVADGLCDKIRQIVSAKTKGQTKVAANVLGALNNQLRAQTGKALTAAEAALISSLAAQL